MYGFDPDVSALSRVCIDITLTKVQLLAMVPQPVKAVVLLFPISKEYEAKRKAEDERIAREGQHPVDPTIIWIKQTVRRAGGRAGVC